MHIVCVKVILFCKNVATICDAFKCTDLGKLQLQFKLPGGICVDKDNNVYVVDEGNNRIQKISKSGHCISTFAWGHNKCFVTDVAYEPSSDCLLVPRAYSDYGMSFTKAGCKQNKMLVLVLHY